jgi:hypothetical protein
VTGKVPRQIATTLNLQQRSLNTTFFLPQWIMAASAKPEAGNTAVP